MPPSDDVQSLGSWSLEKWSPVTWICWPGASTHGAIPLTTGLTFGGDAYAATASRLSTPAGSRARSTFRLSPFILGTSMPGCTRFPSLLDEIGTDNEPPGRERPGVQRVAGDERQRGLVG